MMIILATSEGSNCALYMNMDNILIICQQNQSVLPHYLERCAQGSFQTSGNRGDTRFLGNHASYYIRMLDRGNLEFKLIEKDEKNKERDNIFV
jgi:hypothetical protein